MCHGNSENLDGCSYLLRICSIYGTNVSMSRSWIPLQVADREEGAFWYKKRVEIKILSILKLVSFKSLTGNDFSERSTLAEAHCERNLTVADPGKASLISGPNWGLKGRKKFFGRPPPPLPPYLKIWIRYCLNRQPWSIRRKISQFAVQVILVGIIIKASGASLRVTDLLFAFVFCKK